MLWTKKTALEAAKKAADVLVGDRETLFDLPKVALVLGTGWGDVLMDSIDDMHIENQLSDLPGFEDLRMMDSILGHKKSVVRGDINGTNVLMLRGRIHMNETIMNPQALRMVRLQIQMLLEAGVKHLILTNAAGSLKDDIRVLDVVAHDGFITGFAPPRPMFPGEFVSPEDKLTKENVDKVRMAAESTGLRNHQGAGAMVMGPDFEGRKHDKRLMCETGASMAMMSVLPETAIAALYPDVKVYAVSFITNDDSEEHSHEENQKRAKAMAPKLGEMLIRLIDSLE